MENCTHSSITIIPNISTGNIPSESDSLDFMFTIKLTILSSLLLLIIPGNTLTIAAIIRYKWLQTPANYFICLLAVADLLVAIPIALQIYEVLCPWVRNQPDFIYVFCVYGFIPGNAGLHITLVAVDRAVAVLVPFKYHRIITARSIALMEASVWIISFLITVLPTIVIGVYSKVTGVLQVVVFFTTIFLGSFLHMKVTCLARNHSLQTYPSTAEGHAQTDRTRPLFKVDKATVVFFAIVGCMTIFWSPFLVVRLFETMFGYKLAVGIKLTFFLGNLNSAVNVFVYNAVNSKFRKAYKLILTCNINTRDIAE